MSIPPNLCIYEFNSFADFQLMNYILYWQSVLIILISILLCVFYTGDIVRDSGL